MAKGLLGGMTDYSHQSFSDILNDLEHEQNRTASFRDAIQSHIATLEANKYWKEVVPSHFRDCVYYALRHYNTSIDEFEDIRKDLLLEVKEHHVKRLEKISKVAHEINVDIGTVWHGEYYNKGYGNANFRIVEDIYRDTRNMAVNLLDISNIAERLTDFIGKTSILQPEMDQGDKKKNKFLSMLKSGWGIGAIVAILVLLLGNNWIFRTWDYYHSKEYSDTGKVKAVAPQLQTITDKVLAKFNLPYLKSTPILNKGLFVKYYYNDFVLGGVNIDSISFNARAKDGSRLRIQKENNEILVSITQEPYMEISINGDFYSLEVIGRHHDFNAILTKIVKPTLSLIKYERIYNE